MRTTPRAPRLVTVEPVGAVTVAAVPIPVVAMLRWAPPYGDGSPHPVATLARAWTTAQVRVDGDHWLPARDVHRIQDVPTTRAVVVRVTRPGGREAHVPARTLARATDRRGAEVAVRVRIAPDTDDVEERWVLVSDLVDEDPADGL